MIYGKSYRIENLLCALLLLSSSCSGVYYGAMSKLGYEKRDIMVSRVRDAKVSQTEAKEQFKNALERFNAVLNKSADGKLQDKYNVLSKELERSEEKADKVRKKIASVEDVASALFHEWKKELGEYQNESLRAKSEKKLADSERRYDSMITAMKRAESRLDPALQPLRDDVLYLKHNLNAEAIGSLGSDLNEVESQVATLVRDLETAIDEADKFISQVDS